VIAYLRSQYRLAAAQMARATFYYHLSRLSTPPKHARLQEVIGEIFGRSQGRYGYRKVWYVLRARSWQVSQRLVLKLMQNLGLRSKVLLKRRRYRAYRGAVGTIAPNVLNQQFMVSAPNRVWVSDVTEFRVGRVKVHLSPVLDLYDHSIISYCLSRVPNTTLTTESLRQAFENTAAERARSSKGEGGVLVVHTAVSAFSLG